MFESLAQLRCCDAYLRSVATNVTHRFAASAAGPRSVETSRRVLIVEFSDEVFADLKCLLEDHGWEVARAASGAAVAACMRRFAPQLLLVNESMPDESGWLITCKLRLLGQRQPVWLYAVRKPQVDVDWKEFCGVDKVLTYGGALRRLRLRVRESLASWLDVADATPFPQEALQGAIAAPAQCADAA